MKRQAGVFVVATCVVAALGAASAGDRRAVTSFVCSEVQRTKRTCYPEIDENGRPIRESGRLVRDCSYDQVGRFRGTLRTPLANLGPTFRRLDPATSFSVSIGNVQYSGSLADSDYVPGRAVATFVLTPAEPDPDAVKPAPPLATGRVSWTRTRLTVVISARQVVVLTDPGAEIDPVEIDRSVHAEFGAAHADVAVRLTGVVRVGTFPVDDAEWVTARIGGAGSVGN